MARAPQASLTIPEAPSISGERSVGEETTDVAQTMGVGPDSPLYWVGRTIADRYQLDRVIGAGGMGAVYEARHTLTGKKVALKIMHAELARSSQHVARFLREAKSASAIGHPSIVDVLDAGRTEGGRVYLVMELLEGHDLEDALRFAKLTGDEVLDVGVQLLEGLAAAHGCDVIHRDVKPENIFVMRDEQKGLLVKVLDFGIAKHLGVEPDNSTTRTGTIVGTPEFMSPEQAKGEPIDGRTDVWSTGAVLYYALAGRPPFMADNYNKLIVQILTSPAPSIGIARPDLPADLVQIVDRALESDRARRWSSAAEMADALRRFRASGGLALAAPPTPGKRLSSADRSDRPPLAGSVPSSQAVIPTEIVATQQRTVSRAAEARPRALMAITIAALLLAAVAFAMMLRQRQPTSSSTSPGSGGATSTPATAPGVSGVRPPSSPASAVPSAPAGSELPAPLPVAEPSPEAVPEPAAAGEPSVRIRGRARPHGPSEAATPPAPTPPEVPAPPAKRAPRKIVPATTYD